MSLAPALRPEVLSHKHAYIKLSCQSVYVYFMLSHFILTLFHKKKTRLTSCLASELQDSVGDVWYSKRSSCRVIFHHKTGVHGLTFRLSPLTRLHHIPTVSARSKCKWINAKFSNISNVSIKYCCSWLNVFNRPSTRTAWAPKPDFPPPADLLHRGGPSPVLTWLDVGVS